MTRSDNDGYDLDSIINEIEDTLDQLKARRDANRATAENTKANIEAKQRRRGFFIVPGLAAGVLLGRRILTHPAGSAIASSATTAAMAVAGAFVLTADSGNRPSPTTEPPSITLIEPPDGSPSRTRPSRSKPPVRPEATPPAAQPQPLVSGTRPTGPPATPTPTPSLPESIDEPTIDNPGPSTMPTQPTCQIYLPHVRRNGTLCGTLAE